VVDEFRTLPFNAFAFLFGRNRNQISAGGSADYSARASASFTNFLVTSKA
jgi:hypothetical protein